MVNFSALLHACVVASLLVMGSAWATPVTWTDWRSVSADRKSAVGSMGGVGVSVTATATMNGPSQTSCGFNWWTQPDATEPAYTGGSVSNGPPACEQIALYSATTVTVGFTHAVDTLYMALLSVGNRGSTVTYDFDRAFVIDSEGRGYWGSDDTNGVLGEGNSLAMREFHGVLRFASPLTSLTFSTAPAEYWHAFSFGMPGPSAVPEPAILPLLGIGLVGLGAVRMRRRGPLQTS